MRNNAFSRIVQAAEFIEKKAKVKPVIGVVLGSGLGSVAEQTEDAVAISYTEIPGFHGTSIEGHPGKLIVGKFRGVPAIFLQGRFHHYEGHSFEDVALPVRTLCRLGVKTLILTNAAGGVNTRFRPAELMLIEDHINLMGSNPLMGPNIAELGPRFPDMSEAYDRKCFELMRSVAAEIGVPLHTGVYAGLIGPTYETPAEVRMLRTLGADATGMSTVPETIAANHIGGIRVVGVSCITNLAAGLSPHKLSHQEVIDNSKIGAGKMTKLLEAAIPRLAALT